MTVAIVLPVAGRFVVGADTLCTTGSVVSGRVEKLHRVGNAVVVGAGTWGVLQGILRAARGARVVDPQEFAAVVAEHPRSDEMEWLWVETTGIWEIDGYGGHSQMTGPVGVGTGSQRALGYLGALRPPKTLAQGRSQVRKALEHVCDWYVDCGGPIQVVTV